MVGKSRGDRVSGSIGRCILPMLDTLGWKGGMRSFLNSYPYDYRNFEVSDMMNTMANLGFIVKKSSGNLKNLDVRLLPCLFVDKNEQAHVLIKLEKNCFFSFDGDLSEFTTIDLDEETGDFYFFENLSDSSKNPEREQQDWFSKFFIRFRRPLFTSFFLSLLLTFTALASPFIIMGLYSKINTAVNMDGFWLIGIGILGILFADLFFQLLRDRILGFIGARLGYLVSTQVFKRILSFSPSFTENAPVGTQVVRMRAFNSVRSFVEGPGITSIMEMPFLIILFVALIVMAGYLSLIPVVAAILLLIFSLFVVPFVKKNNSETAESAGLKQSYLIELFSEFRDIRMSGLSKMWTSKFEKISANAAYDLFNTSNINSIINHISQGVVSIAGALTITLGVFGVMEGQISGSVLIAAMMLVWKILSPISSGFTVFSQTIRIKKSLLQLDRLMGMKLETTNDNTPPVFFRGKLRFKGVSLRYKPEYYPALLGIDLSVDQGEFVVLRGHDGAGKSSLLKLLMGMYRPQAGTIKVDGTNIQQLPPSILRRSIAYLPQMDTLFSVSIEKNFKYASPTSTIFNMENMVERLGLSDDINKFPEKLHTQVSEINTIDDPLCFKKRLCIARTLLNDSQIILLDEPDRGIEKKNLKYLMDVLNKIKGNKTVVIATNHPDFIDMADKVITLNIGTITNIESLKDKQD